MTITINFYHVFSKIRVFLGFLHKLKNLLEDCIRHKEVRTLSITINTHLKEKRCEIVGLFTANEEK